MDLRHEIAQQVPILQDDDLWSSDLALQEGLQHYQIEPHAQGLPAYGSLMGSGFMREQAELANRHRPELQCFNHHGERVDTLRFHPAWQQVLHTGMEQGLHKVSPESGAELGRAAGFYLHGQIEAGSLCPMTMTRAAAPLLKQHAQLLPDMTLLDGLGLDDRDVPLAEKTSMLVGMGLTEMQGGSDLSGISTRAQAVGTGHHTLYGHKWFYSVPQADAHLVLAREEQGLSCFWVPRWWQAKRNAVLIRRLKDKLGNASNASAEVEFHGACGLRLGQVGEGVRLLIGMAGRTRIDCVLGSAALMRQAVVQAVYFSRCRSTFGSRLSQHGLMQSVLSDMILESEAATQLALNLAYLSSCGQAREQALLRILAPAAKFWVCKRAIQLCAEAMEVWGGNGYIETSPLPRLYREAPVNSIWEGSGNIMCLDVLRAWQHAAVREHLVAYIEETRGQHEDYDRYAKQLLVRLQQPEPFAVARGLAQSLVLLYQASLLLKIAPAKVAQGFIQSRLVDFDGSAFGLLHQEHAQALLDRAWPG